VRSAVVSQLNSPGGGRRFLRGLLLGLLEQRDAVQEVGLFVDAAARGEPAARDAKRGLLVYS
jgi:hypothetical protein